MELVEKAFYLSISELNYMILVFSTAFSNMVVFLANPAKRSAKPHDHVAVLTLVIHAILHMTDT